MVPNVATAVEVIIERFAGMLASLELASGLVVGRVLRVQNMSPLPRVYGGLVLSSPA